MARLGISSKFDALLEQEFQTHLSIKFTGKYTASVEELDGKKVKAMANADMYLIVVPDSHYQSVAFFVHEPLDYSYQVLPQLVKPLLDLLPKTMDRRFRVDKGNGNFRDYYTDQIPFNNTLYIYSPHFEADKSEITDFFASQGLHVYMRDTEYYEQQWEARRPDVFISHDSADKAAVAEPLYHALTARGLKVWLDKYSLKLGDSLTDKINEGIAECRYGVLILSQSFLANERWAKRELNSFSVKDAIQDKSRILPVWHGITEGDLIALNNYWLIDKVGGRTTDIEALADEIVRAIA